MSGVDLVTGVRPLIRLFLLPLTRRISVVGIGDLDLVRDRARFSSDESEPESFFSSAIESGDLCLDPLVIERVMGAKYESFLSDVSEGVGVGEITLGVGGCAYFDAIIVDRVFSEHRILMCYMCSPSS